MKLVILAAGYATRLYPLTRDRPKQLLEVGGRPILEHLLDRLAPIGFDALYLVTNARFAGAFRAWASGYGDVRVVDDGTTDDATKLGAIGDLDLVIRRERVDDDLVVAAGDSVFSDSLEGFGATARERRAPLLAVYDVADPELVKRYSEVRVDEAGRIIHVEEKPREPRSTLSGVALYHYPRETLPLVARYLSEGGNSDQPGRLVEWLYRLENVYAWQVPGAWLDIGSPETLAEADRLFSEAAAAAPRAAGR
jgi:glucose-1-phosphate thymidylyltransferase